MVKDTICIKTVSELQQVLDIKRKEGKSIGFVPTMGALHNGHLTLMKASQKDNPITVCSIYVNPTQFDNKDDLAKYPQTLEADLELLSSIGVDYCFAPSSQEVYPDGMEVSPKVDLKGLDKQLEGAHRPGHFDGVVQVVHRLLDIVKPDKLYMGQKDFQQFTIIQQMIDDLSMSVQLVVCPIARESHGLARSSRNERLNAVDRSKAGIIHMTLVEMAEQFHTLSIEAILKKATERLSWSWTRLEYVDIVDAQTLLSVKKSEDRQCVAVLAVWIGGVRLIDNMLMPS